VTSRQDKRYEDTVNRLTTKTTEAATFDSKQEAVIAAAVVRKFSMLKGELTPTLIGKLWFLVWSEDEVPLFLTDPAS
jgi:hypothetical protein